jgi:AAA domain
MARPFAEEVDNWRKVLASMPDPAARYAVFTSAASDLANYVAHGFPKPEAVDALQELAQAYGLAGDPDDVQTVIADAFARVEREQEAVPDWVAKGNGQHAPLPGKEAKPPALVPVSQPFPIDEKTIPQRDWLMPGLLMRRQISVLVAPSGSGKSLLTLQVGIACAEGKRWSGWIPRGTFRVMVINSEDDLDEMRRRLAGAAHVMEVDQVAIRSRIVLVDNSHNGAVVAKFDARTKTLVRTPLLEQIVATIIANDIDIVFVDPFAETFEGDENSNSELKWAGIYWREVARRTNAAIVLVHHTKKYASGMAGDVDAARGAGALIGIARIVSTLFPMTMREAETMGVDDDKRGLYLRYDDAKANLNIKSPFARWFFKQTITLGNASAELPGDDVGVLIPWAPAGPSVLEAQIIAFFRRVDQGVLDQDGKPTGEFYSFGNRAADRSVVEFAQEFFQIETRAAAEKLIDGWRKDRRLEQVQYRSPRQRKTRGRAISELDPKAPKNVQVIQQKAQSEEQGAFGL